MMPTGYIWLSEHIASWIGVMVVGEVNCLWEGEVNCLDASHSDGDGRRPVICQPQVDISISQGIMSDDTTSQIVAPSVLLTAFRQYYHQFQDAITYALGNPTDPTVLARLGDDLDEFANLAEHVCLPTTLV
jgi:hypothetical protein